MRFLGDKSESLITLSPNGAEPNRTAPNRTAPNLPVVRLRRRASSNRASRSDPEFVDLNQTQLGSVDQSSQYFSVVSHALHSSTAN